MNLPFQDKWMCKEKWMHAGTLRQNIFLFSLMKKSFCCWSWQPIDNVYQKIKRLRVLNLLFFSERSLTGENEKFYHKQDEHRVASINGKSQEISFCSIASFPIYLRWNQPESTYRTLSQKVISSNHPPQYIMHKQWGQRNSCWTDIDQLSCFKYI